MIFKCPVCGKEFDGDAVVNSAFESYKDFGETQWGDTVELLDEFKVGDEVVKPIDFTCPECESYLLLKLTFECKEATLKEYPI